MARVHSVKQDSGACVQCAAKNCIKAYHPECARRFGMFLGYGYSEAPFWRIYCESHADLEIKQKLQAVPRQYLERVQKLVRCIEKQRELHGDRPVFEQAQAKRICLRVADGAKRGARASQLRKAYLDSYMINTYLCVPQRFYITLHSDEVEGLALEQCNIPGEEEHAQYFQALRSQGAQERKTALKKRAPRRKKRAGTIRVSRLGAERQGQNAGKCT